MSSCDERGPSLLLMLLMLCATPIAVAAQETSGAISGVVRAADGTLLRGVEVFVEGSNRSTLSAADGTFLLQRVPTGRHTVTARSIGYTTVNREIEVVRNRLTRVEIALAQKAVEVSAITVLGVRRYGSSTTGVGKMDANVLDVPQSVVVVSEDFLHDQNATTLEDVLRNVGGLSPFSDYQDFTARGFRQGEDEVTYNGVKANPYNFFATPTLHNVERIEVLKGPGSVLYGSAEGGAIVNVVTKSPRAIPAQNFSVTVGSYDEYRATADVTGPLVGQKLLYRVGGHYSDRGSFRRFQQTKDRSIAPALTWLPRGGTSITLKGELTDDDRRGQRTRGIAAPLGDLNALPKEWTANEPTDRAGNDGRSADLNIDHAFGKSWRAKATARYAYSEYVNQYHESLGFTCSLLPTSSNQTLVATCLERGGRVMIRREFRDQEFSWKNWGGTANINGTIVTGPLEHRLLLNTDLTKKQRMTDPNDFASPVAPLDIFDPQYGVDPSTYVGRNPVNNPFTRDYRDWGVSAMDVVTIIPQVKLMVGGRYNDYSVFNANYRTMTSNKHVRTAYTYRSGLVLQPKQWLSVYGSYSEGFKPQAAANDERGGPFDPLITKQREIGVKASLFDDRLVVTTASYRITKHNVLVNDPEPGSNLLVPLQEVKSKGWDVDAVGSITANWSVTANFAKNETLITEDPRPNIRGTGFPNAPKHASAFWTRYDMPAIHLGLAVGASYVGERNTFDATVLPSYTVIDGALFYDWRNYKLGVNLKNLTDERHFTGGYNGYQLWLGTPRSVQVTLRAFL